MLLLYYFLCSCYYNILVYYFDHFYCFIDVILRIRREAANLNSLPLFLEVVGIHPDSFSLAKLSAQMRNDNVCLFGVRGVQIQYIGLYRKYFTNTTDTIHFYDFHRKIYMNQTIQNDMFITEKSNTSN